MSERIDLWQLSPEQLQELQRQMREQQRAQEEKKRADREAYKQLVDETVEKVYNELKAVAGELQKKKNAVMEEMSRVISLKDELFGIKDGQATNTFTTSDGKLSLCIGYRTINDYDATLGNGIAKVKEYIASLATDEKTGELVDMIESLLRTDKNGNMRPNRVLELSKLASKIDDIGFREGVAIIQQAYTPRKSSTFITAWENTEAGKVYLPLSMTNAE